MAIDAGDIYISLGLDATRFNTALMTAQQQLSNFAQSLGKLGSYLTWRVTLPLTYLGRRAVKAFADFDDAITRSAAVTRGMSIEMRKQMALTATEISKKSILSATELAQGYFALGQAGYSAAQSIKALPVVADFAVASSRTLDESIRYLVRTVNGLGMASEDPIKNMEALTRVSNAFTYAAITTTAEISDFAVAMTHAAAPALKMVNKSVEEGIAVLMAFAKAGIEAEEAGTLLWTTVRDLQRANIKAREQWKKYGLEVYDSTRKMRNLADIFKDLEDRFGYMSDEGKKATFMLLGFQDRSLRGVQALMGFSEEMRFFQQQMEEMGDITEMIAQAYLKSFSSQLKMVGNNLHILGLSIGRSLAPILLKLGEKIKEFITWWQSLSDNVRLVIVEIGIFAVVLGPVLLIMSKMISSLVFLSIGFKVWALVTVKLVAALGLVSLAAVAVLAVVGVLISAIYVLRAAWVQGVDVIKERMEAISEYIRMALSGITKYIGKFVKWLRTDALRDLKEFVKDAGAALLMLNPSYMMAEMIKGKKHPAEIFVEAREKVGRVLDGIGSDVKELYLEIEPYAAAYVEATKEHLGDLGEALKNQFSADKAAVIDLFTKKLKALNQEFLGLLPSEVEQRMIDFVEFVKANKDEIKDLLDTGADALSVWGRYVDNAMLVSERLQEVAVNSFESMTDAIVEFARTGKFEIKEWAASVLSDLLRVIVRIQLLKLWEGLLGPSGGSGIASWLVKGLQGFVAGGNAAAAGVAGAVGGSPYIAPGGINPVTGAGAALGKVLSAGRIVPMQYGGILEATTLIPLARERRVVMAAEAGEKEAIMPLTRDTQGRLGVRSEAAPSPIINNRIINVFSREEILAAMASSAGEKVFINHLRRSGIVP